MRKSMPDVVNEELAEGDDDVYLDPDIDERSTQDDLSTGDMESLDGLSSIAEISVEENWTGIGTPAANKKRKNEIDTRTRKRKKRGTLPAFASYEDYARMIEGAPEDNL
jgi:ribosome biogenesis protein MAK21